MLVQLLVHSINRLEKIVLCLVQILYYSQLQALSNLTGDPYRAHCFINRVPKFKFNNIYKVIRCPQKDNRIIGENTKLHAQEIVS